VGAEGVRPMPYLDVPIRVASDLPAPGQYNAGELKNSHGAKWGSADLPSSLDVVISRSRLLPGPCTWLWQLSFVGLSHNRVPAVMTCNCCGVCDPISGLLCTTDTEAAPASCAMIVLLSFCHDCSQLSAWFCPLVRCQSNRGTEWAQVLILWRHEL
jgi:hypothetical protein